MVVARIETGQCQPANEPVGDEVPGTVNVNGS
jgi:hypothetical protein